MKFVLEIDLGENPSAKTLATQLHKEATLFFTATEELKPQVWGIDDPHTMRTAGKWEIREGKTLADFAGSTKLFKRSRHATPYGFINGMLREIPPGGVSHWAPRLTAEDLTADDWQEVKVGE